jgi:hypothetical protein
LVSPCTLFEHIQKYAEILLADLNGGPVRFEGWVGAQTQPEKRCEIFWKPDNKRIKAEKPGLSQNDSQYCR